MAKFKKGDYLTSIEGYSGFIDAIVTDVDKTHYHLKIPNGTATMKISAEVNYRIKDSKKILNMK